MTVPALVLSGIHKSYFGVPVLKGVDLTVAAGEIHALVGENGAGKSTLMNILFGLPVIHESGGFEGTIHLAGREVRPQTPADAMQHGIGMVHQEFMLLPGFTITENIKLNRERTRRSPFTAVLPGPIRRRARALESLDMPAMRRDARAALGRIGLSLDEGTAIEGLPVGHLQFVEIAREIDKESARVIVFDEPTAVLTESEAKELLDVMKTLARDGIAILFITHRLDEVLAVADRVTVLRDGQRVACLDARATSTEEIARLMIGRDLDAHTDARRADRDRDIVLALEHLAVSMPGERVKDFSIEVRRGEVLGIAGLAGQGKIGIANGIMGLYPASGRVLVAGWELPLGEPLEALRRGLGFVSEDRRQVGLMLDASLEWNVCATAVQAQGLFVRGRGPFALYDRRSARAHAKHMIEAFDIRCQGPDEPVRRLSGGNQQKVCLARVFTLNPHILFVSEPTRGIDVGAKDRVLNLLTDLNQRQGVTIVVTSSELAELRRMAHRIAVVDDGRVAGVLPPGASEVEFGLLFAGAAR